MASRDGGIESELLARAEAIAKLQGETVDDVVERALRAYVERADEVASQGE
jgi:hypothetical protein